MIDRRLQSGKCKPASLCIGQTTEEEDANSCEISPGVVFEGPEDEDVGPALGVCCTEHTSGDQASVAEKFSGDKQEEEQEQAEVGDISLGDVDSIIGERQEAHFGKVFF